MKVVRRTAHWRLEDLPESRKNTQCHSSQAGPLHTRHRAESEMASYRRQQEPMAGEQSHMSKQKPSWNRCFGTHREFLNPGMS